MIKKSMIAAAFVAGLAAASANAALFDFEAAANAGGEGGFNSYSMSNDGITVTATGTDLSGNNRYYAYLDADPWAGSGAGLGVCKALNGAPGVGSSCTPSNDDNVTQGEKLHLVFSQEVTIEAIKFFNGEHQTNFAGNMVNVSIDGGAAVSYALVNNFTTLLTGTKFDFWLANQGLDAKQNKFYISAITAVPAPAPLLLGALGLIGLVVARRKKTA